MENISKLEALMVLVPAAIYWFYILFLILTDATPHPGIKITKRRKVIAPLAVLCPLGLIYLASYAKTTLGIFELPVIYLAFFLMACAPIAAVYALVLLIRQYNAWTPDPARPKYRVNSTDDCILAMNAATNFMRDRKFNEEEEERLDREFEEARRRDEYERNLASDEAEGIFT